MANSVWPSTLPQYVLEQGYGEEKQDQALRTPMEGGATKTRRRFTARFDGLSVRLMMDSEQVDLFEQFYEMLLKGGTLPFDWVHPRKGNAVTLQIIGKVAISPAGGDNYVVSFKVEIKP